MERLLFSIFAAGSIASGIGMVALRDPVRSALSLVSAFFCLGCLYLLQAAELLAVLEVMVYAGAIMVLFVFVIMLVEHHDEPVVQPTMLRRAMVPVKILAVVLVAVNMIRVIMSRSPFIGVEKLPAGFGTPRSIGIEFFKSFGFQFELASVLLLAAIVGAVVISKPKGPHADALKDAVQ